MKFVLALLCIFGAALLAESACPMICPFNYAPVCGSDGVTYSNECAFKSAACIKKTLKTPELITLSSRGACSP